MGHLTHRDSKVWTWQSSYSIPETYTNNRSSAASYDAEGNQTENLDATYTFDAAGNIRTVATSDPQSTTTRTVDGTGQQLKAVTSTYNETTQSWINTTSYYLHSTVLGGQVLTELNENGSKHKTYVYAGNQVLASKEIFAYNNSQGVAWEHRDPSNASYRVSYNTGDLADYRELDPLGADTISDPNGLQQLNPPDDGTGSLLPYPSFSSPTRPGTAYLLDGIPVTTDVFMRALDNSSHGSFTGFTPKPNGSAPIPLRSVPPDGLPGQESDELELVPNPYTDELEYVPMPRRYSGRDHIILAEALLPSTLPQNPSGGGGRVTSPETYKDDAYSHAAKALKDDKDCAAFFGITDNKSLRRVLGVLKSIERRSTIDETYVYSTAKTEGSGGTAHVTLGHAFFYDPAIRVNVIHSPTDPTEFRAHTILHEFAHALNLIPDDPGLNQGIANNETITKHCGKGLSALVGVSGEHH